MRYIELLAESSLVFAGFTVLLFALRESDSPRAIPKISSRMTQRGHPPLAPRILWLGFGTSTVGCLLLFANFVGWPLAPSSFLYGAGLTLFLAIGVVGVVGKFWLSLTEFIR